MSISILATGDLHLGTKVSGLPASINTYSARENWLRIANWAVNNNVDVVALTGDIIDRNNRYYESVGPLQNAFAKFKENNISVFLVAGNHDYDVLPQIIKAGNYDNVRLLGEGGKWELVVYEKNNKKVQFVGWSFNKSHIKISALTNFNLENIDRDIPCVGLMHADYGIKNSNYNPVALNEFTPFDIQTWILGHIHKPGEVNNSNPYIIYPGSPLPLSRKETGLHSLVLIEIKDNYIIEKAQRILNAPLRFEEIKIDITAAEGEAALREKLVNDLLEKASSMEDELQDLEYLSFDLTLTGSYSNPLHAESWSAELEKDFKYELNGTKIGVHKISYDILPELSNINELAKQNSPVGILAGIIVDLENERETETIKTLLATWNEKYNEVNRKEIYLPLQGSEMFEDKMEKTGKNMILAESKKLLGYLLYQRNQ